MVLTRKERKSIMFPHSERNGLSSIYKNKRKGFTIGCFPRQTMVNSKNGVCGHFL